METWKWKWKWKDTQPGMKVESQYIYVIALTKPGNAFVFDNSGSGLPFSR